MFTKGIKLRFDLLLYTQLDYLANSGSSCAYYYRLIYAVSKRRYRHKYCEY